MTFWDVPGARKLASLTIENKHLQGLDGASPCQMNFIDDFTLNQVKLHVIKMPDCAVPIAGSLQECSVFRSKVDTSGNIKLQSSSKDNTLALRMTWSKLRALRCD